ncbi:DUF3102 domain-containing protein [Agrobacterium vitis]
MLTEIEVEDIGTMRHLNVWQLERIKRMRPGPDKEIAVIAFGLGSTVRQFKKLPLDQCKAAHDANDRLYAPAPFPSPEIRQRPPVPRKGEHASIEKKIELGRQLIHMKTQLPRGHFIPWVEEKSGITYGQAQRWMKIAKEVEM